MSTVFRGPPHQFNLFVPKMIYWRWYLVLNYPHLKSVLYHGSELPKKQYRRKVCIGDPSASS